MTDDRIPAWLPLVSYLGKGPKNLLLVIRWRILRKIHQLLAAPAVWPAKEEILSAFGQKRKDATDNSRHSLLNQHYRSKSIAAKLCSEEQHINLIQSIDHELVTNTIYCAKKIANKEFDYRGERVAFTEKIDWLHCPNNNTDWTWDINRHYFAVDLGRAYRYTKEETYAETCIQLLNEWMDDCPPAIQSPVWESVFETAIRISNWLWVYSLLLPSRAFDSAAQVALQRGLLGMGRYLNRHIELHSRNNHLLIEAKALLLLGLTFPKLPGSEKWRNRGMRLVESELSQQVCRDGVHSERSSMYHQVVASEIAELFTVMSIAQVKTETIRKYLEQLTSFSAALTREDGSIPMLGDSSRNDDHVRFDAVLAMDLLKRAECETDNMNGAFGVPHHHPLAESTHWLVQPLYKILGCEPAPSLERATVSSRLFPDGGYAVMRSTSSRDPMHLVFDCGPFGDRRVPRHGHADALSFDLAVGSNNFLLDPGTYSTHLGNKWRNYFRGTAAHNTIQVDGLNQSILKGTYGSYRTANTVIEEWFTSSAFDIVAAKHDGYQRLTDPVTHYRQIFFCKPKFWIILDYLDATAHHVYDLHFHMPPGFDVTQNTAGDSVTVTGADHRHLSIIGGKPSGIELEIVEGDESVPQGWIAEVSGKRDAAPVLRLRRTGDGPQTFVSVIVPHYERDVLYERLPVKDSLSGENCDNYVAGRVCVPEIYDDTFIMQTTASKGAQDTQIDVRKVFAGNLSTDGRTAVASNINANSQEALRIGGSFLAVDQRLQATSRQHGEYFWWGDS